MMQELMVGKFSEFGETEHRIFAFGELEFAIFRLGEKVVAYHNHCPHLGGPVCQGGIFRRVEERLAADKKSLGVNFSSERHIVCPWHGFEFDLATGCHPGDPRLRLKSVDVELRGDEIYVRLGARLSV